MYFIRFIKNIFYQNLRIWSIKFLLKSTPLSFKITVLTVTVLTKSLLEASLEVSLHSLGLNENMLIICSKFTFWIVCNILIFSMMVIQTVLTQKKSFHPLFFFFFFFS